MRFIALALKDAFRVEIERQEDERGFFARAWCLTEAAAQGIDVNWRQCSISFNRRAGTLRGLHYQAPPHAEAKLVRCTSGRVFDVILDLRSGSATRGKWLGMELSAKARDMLYVPEGFAHGFQTLEPDTEVFYQISCDYVPDAARGVRWNDPALAIDWPLPVTGLSERDRTLPSLDDQ